MAFSAAAASAQQPKHQQVDVAVSYVAEHANPVGPGGNFWLQGGSVELGVNAWHGLGIAAKVTGTHTAKFGPDAIPLSLVSTTFGPRYRLAMPKLKKVSVFGEGLIGEDHGLGSFFPTKAGIDDSAVSLAVEVGGGIDWEASRHFAVRAVQASWVRSQLPNSTTNVQNNLRLGAGLVVKF